MRKIYFILMIAASALASCKKEGCTDPDAVNYNADAGKDDSSCKYEGSIVFWYRQDIADDLAMNGVSLLAASFFIENVGTHVPNNPTSSAPECGAVGSFTIVRDMGSNKTQLIDYLVEEVDGFGFWGDLVTLQANKCKAIELY